MGKRFSPLVVFIWLTFIFFSRSFLPCCRLRCIVVCVFRPSREVSSSGQEDDNKPEGLTKKGRGGGNEKSKLVNVANWVAAGRAPPTPNASEFYHVIHHQHLDARQPRLLFSMWPAPELSWRSFVLCFCYFVFCWVFIFILLGGERLILSLVSS